MSSLNTIQHRPTAIHQANIDLFTFAAKCMAQGDTGSLNRAGLSIRDLPLLRQLSLSQLMAMSERGAALHDYLRRIRSESMRGELEQALVQQGAPRELMMAVFGMSTRRYSAERLRLGIVGPRGRPVTAHIDSATEQCIWRLWVTLADEHDARRLRHSDNWLLIALELPGHLRSAWSLIQQWARDDDAMVALEGDRLRLTIEALALNEKALRVKHGVDFH